VNEAPHQAIDALFLEERRYPPPPELAKEANAQPGIYDRDFVEFWASEARERVSWSTPVDQVCEWDPPYARWFLGGRLNACYNCVDRHVEAGRGREGRLLLGGRARRRPAHDHLRRPAASQ
jgi:acetyl-CoA synthetase